jgi:hypothetical protein
MNWKFYENKSSLTQPRYFLGIYLEGVKKTTKNPVRIHGAPAKIRFGHLQNINHRHYLFRTHLLGINRVVFTLSWELTVPSSVTPSAIFSSCWIVLIHSYGKYIPQNLGI